MVEVEKCMLTNDICLLKSYILIPIFGTLNPIFRYKKNLNWPKSEKEKPLKS